MNGYTLILICWACVLIGFVVGIFAHCLFSINHEDDISDSFVKYLSDKGDKNEG